MNTLTTKLARIHKTINTVAAWLQSVGEADGDSLACAMRVHGIDRLDAIGAAAFLAVGGVVGMEGDREELVHFWSIGGAE